MSAAIGEHPHSPATLAGAVAAGRMSGRLWLYANYHCNLACTYCLTESAPGVPRRLLGGDRMRALADEAATLGFTAIGVTGGEPLLLPDLPEVVADLAARLPVVVLSNATLFTPALVQRLRPWADLPVTVQVSLDRPDPVDNDAMRGPHNFRKVVEGVPRLVDAGLHVRVATTLELDEIGPEPTADQERLCVLHRALGVADEDHVIRPIVRRGRAATQGLGVVAARDDLEPELTVTADGAFWSPFAPTVTGGRLDIDLLVSRSTTPLELPVSRMLRFLEGRSPGHDTTLGIR